MWRWWRKTPDDVRYHMLIGRIQELHRWCDGEAADVARWLLEHEVGRGSATLPRDIWNFRELIRSKRAKSPP